MLTPEEEQTLATYNAIMNVRNNPSRRLTKKDIVWLIRKLREVNEEFKKYTIHVNKLVDEEWKQHWEYNKEVDKGDDIVLDDR